jgi:hypothetical protein
MKKVRDIKTSTNGERDIESELQRLCEAAKRKGWKITVARKAVDQGLTLGGASLDKRSTNVKFCDLGGLPTCAR